MKRVFNKLSGLILVLTLIIALAIYSYDDTIMTSASSLSNSKICWGIKREKDNKQPDLR